uniref:Uncharacterized protein n=1 Tax=Oryza sativa subsp. japonica TaxID=39947 RepID=Q6ZL44_ORYSJ|nr:hypothetical protein [Oryza sativa Japonica Group]
MGNRARRRPGGSGDEENEQRKVGGSRRAPSLCPWHPPSSTPHEPIHGEVHAAAREKLRRAAARHQIGQRGRSCDEHETSCWILNSCSPATNSPVLGSAATEGDLGEGGGGIWRSPVLGRAMQRGRSSSPALGGAAIEEELKLTTGHSGTRERKERAHRRLHCVG